MDTTRSVAINITDTESQRVLEIVVDTADDAKALVFAIMLVKVHSKQTSFLHSLILASLIRSINNPIDQTNIYCPLCYFLAYSSL